MGSNPVEVPNFFLFHLNLSYSCNLHVKKKKNLLVTYILLFDFLMARQWPQHHKGFWQNLQGQMD